MGSSQMFAAICISYIVVTRLWTLNGLPLACITPAFISKIVELATCAAFLASEQARAGHKAYCDVVLWSNLSICNKAFVSRCPSYKFSVF
jgi:hypothetical protein